MANQQRAPPKVSSLRRALMDFLGFLDPAHGPKLLENSKNFLGFSQNAVWWEDLSPTSPESWT